MLINKMKEREVLNLMDIKKVWIKEAIFDWEGYQGGGTIADKKMLERPYQIWEHSSTLFNHKSGNDFHFSDGIANLKRSINHRLQSIEKIYQFRTLEFVNKPKGSLEVLESLGLVRPYIMKQLFEIRNDIEHRDEKPPGIERCNELLDVVWYFLKSTDSLVQIVKSEGEFTLYTQSEFETHYGFSIELKYGDINKSSIRGWFPEEYIRNEKADGFIAVILEDMHGKEKWEGKEVNYHKNKLDSDKWINGYLNFEAHNIIKPIKSVLSLF
jgi:hypothetical protein